MTRADDSHASSAAAADPPAGRLRRFAAWLHARPRDAGCGCSSPARLGGWSSPTWGRCSILLLGRLLGRRTPFTGQVQPFDWSLDAFEDIISNDVYRTIAVRTIGMAVAVTLTDVLLAFPIAYYMARVASPRMRGLLVVAVLLPLWAAYLVKVYAWRAILQGNGVLEWVLTPVRHRRARARADRELVGRAQLPVAAVHDPADLRRPRAHPGVAARGVGGPRRPERHDLPPGDPAARLPGRSWPDRSSPSR